MAYTHARTMELQLPSEPQRIRQVRQRFAEFIAPAGLTPEDRDGLAVALSEACTNAISHGSPHGAADHFQVWCSLSERDLTIEVTDQGDRAWSADQPLQPRGELETSGRGLLLMKYFCDDFEVRQTAAGTVVRLRKRLGAPKSGGSGPPTVSRGHQASALPSRRGSDPPQSSASAGWS